MSDVFFLLGYSNDNKSASVFKGRSCSSGLTHAQPLDGEVVRRGFIRSPNWPGSYPAGVDCEWTITGERGRHILVVVSRVELATNNISPTTDEHHCNTTTNISTMGDWLAISYMTGRLSTHSIGLSVDLYVIT